MPRKFDPRNRELLLSEERHTQLQPRALLRQMGLKSGDIMADIGAGPGFFTLPAAEIVGERGMVLAADIQGEMLSALKTRLVEQGLTNVRLMKMNDTETPLPPQFCDLVLAAFVLHEVPGRASFLRRLALLLKPEGRLAVIEWEKREDSPGPPLEDRISPEELVADAHAAGLRLRRRRELNERQYLAIFTAATADI
jgi:ubiquinone/menaquinone biosynthesis C-methylase UbiE